MDLDSVADDLYGVDPAEFTRARDTAARNARTAGDQVLAKSISQLRKPTQAAWLANLLVREVPGDVDGLLDLGAQLRAAQSALDGDEIRRLTQRRRTTLASLLTTVEAIATRHGTTPSATVASDVEATLEAAVADPEAGAALSSGRLTTPMRYAGFGGVDLDGVVATPVRGGPARAAPARPNEATSGTRPATAAEVGPGRRPAPAERRTTPKSDRAARLAEARADLTAADQRTAAAQADLEEAAAALRAAESRRAEIEERMAALERDLADARRAVVDARRQRDRAAKVVTSARRQRDTAEVRLSVFEA